MGEGDSLFEPGISSSFRCKYAGCREREEKRRMERKKKKVNFSFSDKFCIIKLKQIIVSAKYKNCLSKCSIQSHI